MNAAHVESAPDGSQREVDLKVKDETYVEEQHNGNTDATAGTFVYGIDAAHQKKVMYVPGTGLSFGSRTTDLITVGE